MNDIKTQADKAILQSIDREISRVLEIAKSLQTKPHHAVYVLVDWQYNLYRNGILKYRLNEPVYVALQESGLLKEWRPTEPNYMGHRHTASSHLYKIVAPSER